jgi:hypothetical protein
MAYVLYGSRYIGTGALPTPVAGFECQDTSTGNLYEANTSATAWNLAGNVNSANLGMLPITGGTMQGAILGATGWATADANNFATTVKRATIDLVDATQLATQVTAINNGIGPKVTSAVAALAAGISVKGSVAKSQGILFPIGTSIAQGGIDTIPLPTYPDGTTALQTECVWTVGIYSIPDNGNGLKKILTTNPGGGLIYTCDCYLDTGTYTGHAELRYMIIGIKS